MRPSPRLRLRHVLAAAAFSVAAAEHHHSSRRLEIASDTTDPYAEAKVFASLQGPGVGLGAVDHARMTSILNTTKEAVNTARLLFKDPNSQNEANEMLAMATAMVGEVKDFLKARQEQLQSSTEEDRLLRAKYASHNVQEARENEERALDITRNMYETFISFPDCMEQFLSDCMETINKDLKKLGLSTIEMLVHEKRNIDQEGYNKVVIVTDKKARVVVGRMGDGIVSYPFQWMGSTGPIPLGVDGKWQCSTLSPEECCAMITQGSPHPDIKGNFLQCHIFVPFGGVGNKKRNDRVFINLSPDGRVHEAPIIQ